jgi:DNA-binding winged helix-turn-helix (wHTH) protein/Tol biopolymer transport system component
MEEANRPNSSTLCFGVFEVDLRSGELRKSGVRIKVQELPFKVLTALLEHPGEVVTREELRRRIWPEEAYGDFDHAVNVAVGKLRTALGDSAEIPRIIETLHRRGYRLILPVTVPTGDPSGTSRGFSTTISADRRIAVPRPSTWYPDHLRRWGIVVTIVIAIAGLGFLVRWRSWPNRAPTLQNAELIKLTDTGKAAYVAISPDGRYAVYALREGEKLGLWVRQVATRSDVQILPPNAVDFQGLSFSPDGNYIYFVRSDENNPNYKYLYVMPVLGGPARLLIKDVDCAPSFSPDGRQFVFTRGTPSRNVVEALVANTDGSGEHVIAAFPNGHPADNPGAAWSHDGRTIAVPVLFISNQVRWVLYTLSVSDGRRRELYSSPGAIGRPVWLPDDGALIVPLREPFGTMRVQLWTISYPQGKALRFTNDLSNYDLLIDLTRDGTTLAATVTTQISNIWIAPATTTSNVRQITFGELPMVLVTAFAGGKVLSQSLDGKLWIMNDDGTERAIFTDVPGSFWLRPCGRYAVFDSFQTGELTLMRVNADGSNPEKLVSGDVWSPICSQDGKFVFYFNFAHPEKIWRISITGGSPTAISDVLGEGGMDGPQISPDGQFLAYGYQLASPPAWKVAVIPIDGGPPVREFGVPGDISRLHWSASGAALQYLITRKGVTNIWEQPLQGGDPRQLTKFTSGQIFDFDWSADHKQLLLTRGNLSSDVVLLRNFR